VPYLSASAIRLPREAALVMCPLLLRLDLPLLHVQINMSLKLTFRRLYIELLPVEFSNGSVIVSTVFGLQSHINVSAYSSSLLSNLYDVFLDAGIYFDNSSISMLSVITYRSVLLGWVECIRPYCNQWSRSVSIIMVLVVGYCSTNAGLRNICHAGQCI